MALLKKSSIVGVSVTPEVGLEVAQIDFATQTVLKYGIRQLEYDASRREIADLDLFKEALQDLFFELQIPKGTEVVLNIPTVAFKTMIIRQLLMKLRFLMQLKKSLLTIISLKQ